MAPSGRLQRATRGKLGNWLNKARKGPKGAWTWARTGDAPYRRETIVATIAVLVGLFLPAVVREIGDIGGAVGDLALSPFDLGPSEAERGVANLQATKNSHYWREAPSLSERSKQLLLAHWDRLDPYSVHDEAIPPGETLASLEQLNGDRILGGKVLELEGAVSGVTNYPGPDESSVLQRFSFRYQDESDAPITCTSTLPYQRRVRPGDYVRVAAVVVAWGYRAQDGEAAVTLACPVVLSGPRERAATHVESIYHGQYEDSHHFWTQPPEFDFKSRELLTRKWGLLNAEHRHSYLGSGRYTGQDQVFSDERLRGRLLELDGTVGQYFLDAAPNGGQAVRENFSLRQRDNLAQVWCMTTVGPNQIVRSGDYIAVEGLSIARGDAGTDSGGFLLTTMMECRYTYIFHRAGN